MRASSSGEDSSSSSLVGPIHHHHHHNREECGVGHSSSIRSLLDNNIQKDQELLEINISHSNNNSNNNFTMIPTNSANNSGSINNSPSNHYHNNNNQYFLRNESVQTLDTPNIQTQLRGDHPVNNSTSPGDEDRSSYDGVFQKTRGKVENLLEGILRYFCCVSHFSRNNTRLLASHNITSSDYGSRTFIKVLKKNDHINIVKDTSTRRRSLFSQGSSTAVKSIKTKKTIRLMSDINEYSGDNDEDQIIESEYSFWMWLKCFFGNLTFICHPPKCFTIMNILVILFILQGLIGIVSSFILLYASGESVLKETETIQQIQIKTYSKNELLKIVDYTNLAVETIKFEMAESDFNMNNKLHWSRLFNYVASIYGSSIPIDGIFFGRYDNHYIGYNRNIQHTIRNGTAGKNQCQYFYTAHLDTIITDESYFIDNLAYSTCNLSVNVLKRPWYATYTREENPWTSIRWAPVFKSIYGEQSIAVTIPLYVNQTLSKALNQTNLKYIPADTAPLSIKNTGQLFGVVGFQLQSLALGQLLKNTSELFGEVDMVFITNPDGDLIAVNSLAGSTYFGYATSIIQDYSSRGLLQVINTTTCEITNSVLCSKTLENRYYTFDGDVYSVELSFVTDLYSLGWGVAVASRSKTFADEVVTGGITSVVVFIIVFIFGMMILFFTLKAISNPIQQLSIDMLKLTNLKDKGKEETLSVFSDIREMQLYIKSMKRGLITFSKFVPEVVVEKVMIKQDYSYGEASLSRQNMTVLCCELHPSEIFKEMRPSALLNLLNDYFILVCNSTNNYGGLVDKFNTNALVCYFNESTFPVFNHEQLACSAALEIVTQVENELNDKHLPNNFSKLSIAVSVNSGEMICGQLGSTTRMNFSMIGKNYDMATNLLCLNNHYKTKVLIGENTFRKIKDNFICYFVDTLEMSKVSSTLYSTFKAVSSGDLTTYENATAEENGTCNIYELICHMDEASELHKKIQSDLFQIQFFLERQQYYYLYDKCLCVLALEDLQSVEYLKSKYKNQLDHHL